MRSSSRKIQGVLFGGVVCFLFLTFYFGLNLIRADKTDFNASRFDPKLAAINANSQCQNDSSLRCFKNFFGNFAQLHKFEQTKLVLDELIKINNSVSYCHSIAHEISVAEVAKDPENWLKVFSYVPSGECSYGFFHGVIEGKYKTDPNLTVNSDFINKVCLEQLPSIASKDSSRGCAHAFGHVLLLNANGEVGEAIKECRSVGERIKDACFQGVFMEHIQKDSLSDHGIEVRPEWDKKYVETEKKSCDKYQGVENVECWRSLGPAIMKSANFNYIVAVNECKSASLELSKKACTRKVLGQILVDEFSRGIKPDEDYCQMFEAKVEHKVCLDDVISYVMLTSLGYKDQMEAYCSILQEADYCLQSVEKF